MAARLRCQTGQLPRYACVLHFSDGLSAYKGKGCPDNTERNQTKPHPPP
ncbi:hypothetical protein HMPREF9123_1571 [Neisseria bacilliformis ATCC BAA-1200]|uniref:Uncharacterized protein n=1 Tax=Neisseria bacilliformis ATCC BAA-1200 TaxID=888742 RepID=F2BD14_9NEIS|nr:hypothetical protein HMPREF9123_1571 [Neisseria bacilliformis ATCC BAA-1200]